jgi:hypothetical protein
MTEKHKLKKSQMTMKGSRSNKDLGKTQSFSKRFSLWQGMRLTSGHEHTCSM